MLSFIEPHYIWLLILLPGLVWLGWINRRRIGTGRTVASLALRLLMLVALVGSIAGTQLVKPVKQLTSIFLIDVSDSITPNQRAQQEIFINNALTTMPDGDQAAIILFGENAQIERIPSDERRLGRLQAVPVATRTDIEQALNLGLALFPADTQKRIVLLSDGGENTGRALSALRLANQRDASIDVVQIEIVQGNEVALVSLQVPNQARQGQELALRATIESSSDQSALLRFTVDDQPVLEQAIELVRGTEEFTTTVILDDPGYHRLVAEVVPTDDIRAQNNRIINLVNVLGEPRVLVLTGEPQDGQVIEQALIAAGLNPTVIAADQASRNLADYVEYECVILANVPERDLSTEQQALLQTYVQDLGYGMVVIGGDNSYGIGGYAGSVLEEMLPLEMQLRNIEKYPAVSVAISFDISGSMSEVIGGRQKVQIAAEGAARVVQLLRDFDTLTVIPFDSVPQNPYGPITGADREVAVDEIIARGVSGGGGIAVLSSLQDAYNRIKQQTTPIRHIIILADGSDSQEQQGTVELAKRIRKDGITLSTVAIGDGLDVPFLRSVAQAGGGRSFLVENALDLPDILLQEAQLSLAPYLYEADYIPLLGNDSPVLANLVNQQWPTLHGLVGTMPREQGTVVLWGPDDLPLLAQWQYGLGRTVAWTSDFKGKWGQDLIAWQQAPRLIAQMVGWTLPVVSGDTINVETNFIGSEVDVTVFANDEQNLPLTGYNTQINVVNGEGLVEQLTLSESGSGVYRGRFASPPTGTYFMQLGMTDSQDRPAFQRNFGLIVPYSTEYRQGQANPQLLQTLADDTMGRVLTEPDAVFEHNLAAVRRTTPIQFPLLLFALLLLPLDIAVRRLRWKSLREGLAANRQPKPSYVGVPVNAQLKQARERAQERFVPTQTVNDKPIYQAAPPPPVREAPPTPVQTAEPPPASAKPAAPTPTPSQSPPPTNFDEIEDPLERLRAAKNRARRR